MALSYEEARKMGCTNEQATAIAEQAPGGNGATPERARQYGMENLAKKIEEEVSKPEPVKKTVKKKKGKK